MKRLAILLALAGPALLLSSSVSAEPADRRTRRLVDADLQSRAAMEEAAKAAASDRRHREMVAAEKLLHENRSLTSDQRADLMLRLADLYFREGRATYLDEMLRFQQLFDACFNDAECDPNTLIADTSGSEAWYDKSIRLYGIILHNYPLFPRADEATFFLASALDDLDRDDEAVRSYIDLVKNYPQSEFVPTSYLLIGEHQFEKGEVFKATLAYKKATAYRHHEHYALALYKLSWCYYNLGEYGLALDTIKRVITWSDETLESTDHQGTIDLREDAYRDLVRFCADGGDLDECVHFINPRGRQDLVRDTMVRLGRTYVEQGKDVDALQLYKRLISTDPKHADAGAYQAEIVAISRKMGRVDETVDELERLLRDYSPLSAWAQANATTPDVVSDLSERASKDLANLAIAWHQEARKLGSGPRAEKLSASADRLYGVYRSEFPDGAHVYEVTFAHAELLFARKSYEASWSAYSSVVEMDPKGKHGQFSAEAAIHAAAKLAGEPDEATGLEPVPFTEWEQNHLVSLDKYVELYPSGPKAQFAMFKSAWLLYHRNEFALAAERFRVVIAQDPGSQEARYAANLILDSLALVEDWATLKTTSLAFFEQQDLGNAAFKKSTWKVHERASFKLIEADRGESGDDVAAANALISFEKTFPESDVGDLALNNAAVWFAAAGQRTDAMSARRDLLERYPDSKFAGDTLVALAFDHESSADFEHAALLYERVAAEHVGHASAETALYSAGLFRRALGDTDAALTDLRALLALNSVRDDARELELQVARLHRANGADDAARRTLQVLLAAEPEAEVRMVAWLELVELSADPDAERERALAWVAEQDALSPSVAEVAARMRYAQVEPLWEAYAALRIDGPGRSVSIAQENRMLGDQLKAKTEALSGLEVRYAEVIDTGSGPWGVASLVRVGLAYENLAETLVTSHIPTFLTPEQAEMYRQDLNDRAELMRLKAQTAYETAHQKAVELDVYDDSTATALARLQELDPEAWTARAEVLPSPGYASGAAHTATFEEEL
ncbi:MAG: tetratricopeptide repeat protein [Proteobacteria bacterium]|nr:tetratricopeptide repeat protein [Pseudomonadota bacterium]MCP4915852.1 tetratricopeptide repeat protein [Pseudomonadota bacterium]